MRRFVPLAAVAVLALPAAASAQAPLPTPSTTTPAVPAPAKPKPKPAAPKVVAKTPTVTLRLENAGGSSRTILTGQRFRVRGAVRPYVPGQKVVVRFYRHGRKIATNSVALQPAGGGSFGRFLVGFASKSGGTVTVRVSHRATPQLKTFVTHGRSVRIVEPAARPGQRGFVVRYLQGLMAAKGYEIGAKGVYDGRTARGVLAFRKYTGMARTTVASPDVFRALAAGKGAFKVRYPSHGKHVEGDLTHQVLALIGAGGKVQRLIPMSSGKPSTPTVLGHFHVYRKDPGYNSEGMYFSSYFIRGYAVHGYASVPTFNASHGCMRVPIPDAHGIYNWISIGDPVDVYYR